MMTRREWMRQAGRVTAVAAMPQSPDRGGLAQTLASRHLQTVARGSRPIETDDRQPTLSGENKVEKGGKF
jgi:hypothetical protein